MNNGNSSPATNIMLSVSTTLRAFNQPITSHPLDRTRMLRGGGPKIISIRQNVKECPLHTCEQQKYAYYQSQGNLPDKEQDASKRGKL